MTNSFKYITILAAMLLSLLVSACEKKHEPDDPEEEHAKSVVIDPEAATRVVLVYAVNKSSLSYDFIDDSNEMLNAMQGVDPQKNRLMVYNTIDSSKCGLYIAGKSETGDEFEFKLVKEYPRDVTSTHPRRIWDVINDTLEIFPNASFDLIFWGHGTSWVPKFSDHTVVAPPTVYGYGGEYSGDGSRTDWTDIDELADAVPSGVFDTIWFDCCYMSGIEVIYQFRDKCKWFVGYPTEVWQYGLAYDKMLPHLFQETPDVVGAATAFYDFYSNKNLPVTVAVVKMDALEMVADVAASINRCGSRGPDPTQLLNYSRMTRDPLYDLRQFYVDKALENLEPDLAEEMYNVMENLVVYHAESDCNFNDVPWLTRYISGISTHYFTGADSPTDNYYRTLDWFKRVY